MSEPHITVDRMAIRQMLEDGFRSQLLFQGNYIDTHPRSSPQESIAADRIFSAAGQNGLMQPPL
jgi:hypothetical protein